MDNTNTIRIDIKDWLFNAGILGLYRILVHAEQGVIKKENYIQFDLPALEHFEDHFFNYLFDTYEKESLWARLTAYYRQHFSPGSTSATAAATGSADTTPGAPPDDEKKIKDFCASFDKELDNASYRTAYEIASGNKDFIKEKLKTIKDKKLPPAQRLEKIKEIYDFFIEHKRFIMAKYVTYQVINCYWSGVSFLNKQQVSLDMFRLYKKDFVTPVFDFFAAKAKKNPFGNCLVCGRVIQAKSDGFEGLSWLNLDLDPARKTSVYWNHNPDMVVCPVCHLVYSCVPAGFTTFRRKGLFINDNTAAARLIAINTAALERLNDIKNPDSLENFTYSQIINLVRQMQEKESKEEIDNIQVIKYDPDRGYSFNLLSKQVIRVIDKSEKLLKDLAEMKRVQLDSKNRIDLYAEVIDRIYRNIDLYPLVALLLGLALRRKWRSSGMADLIFKINMNFIGGNMSDKKILALKHLGLALKKGYHEQSNKIPGIAYRLLNHLKTKNINGFMDIMINCHMHIGIEVPTLFVECIDDMERFQAYGYAFLLGFTGQEYNPEGKKDAQL
jgi:CRISPR-associated protein Cst1